MSYTDVNRKNPNFDGIKDIFDDTQWIILQQNAPALKVA